MRVSSIDESRESRASPSGMPREDGEDGLCAGGENVNGSGERRMYARWMRSRGPTAVLVNPSTHVALSPRRA